VVGGRQPRRDTRDLSFRPRVAHSSRVTVETDNPAASNPTFDATIGKLHRSFRAALIVYFSRRVGSAAEAEDLTQDVFERILRVPGLNIINPEALIFRIAVNLLRDRARKRHTHGTEESLNSENILEFAEAITEDLSPERVVIGERTLHDVLLALEELGERTSGIFYLYRLENLRVREIADFYGISASAVEKHLAKALFHLTRRKGLK